MTTTVKVQCDGLTYLVDVDPAEPERIEACSYILEWYLSEAEIRELKGNSLFSLRLSQEIEKLKLRP